MDDDDVLLLSAAICRILIYLRRRKRRRRFWIHSVNANRHAQDFLLSNNTFGCRLSSLMISWVKSRIAYSCATQSIETISLWLCCDWTAAFTIAAIETRSVFLLSLTTQCTGGNGAHWIRWKTTFLFHSRSAAIYITLIAIAMKRCYHSDSYLKLLLSQCSAAPVETGLNVRTTNLIQQVTVCARNVHKELWHKHKDGYTTVPLRYRWCAEQVLPMW